MNFSPYQPPPDAPSSGSSSPPRGNNKNNKGKGKPWFSREGAAGGGYQSGAGVADNTAAAAAFGNDPEEALYGYGGDAGPSSGGGGGGYGYPSAPAIANEERVNAWESRFGWRIDVMAAAVYLGGPVTALLFLILETQNDYVRFHAYQSALLTTPLVIFILLTNLVIPLWSWLRTLIILAGIGVTLYASFRAYKDAQEGLGRFWLPYIGEMAERYVNEE